MISLLCLLPLAVMAQHVAGEAVTPTIGGVRYYNVQIALPKADLSGICILKPEPTGTSGSIVNEFGIKALDFTYDASRQKVSLHHVISFMDKWYIRCTLRRDLAMMMRQDADFDTKAYARQTSADGTLRLENKKRKITYLLTPITQDGTAQ